MSGYSMLVPVGQEMYCSSLKILGYVTLKKN